MRYLIRLIVALFVMTTLSGCFIPYSSRERVVWVRRPNALLITPAASREIRFSHAVPGIYLPHPPRPVTARLDSNGEATVSLPTVTGWFGMEDYHCLIQPRDIRQGGSFIMYRLRNSARVFDDRFVLEIRKPESYSEPGHALENSRSPSHYHSE